MFFLWQFLILIFAIFVIISVLFITLRIELEFINVRVNIPKKKNRYLNENYKIKFRLYLFRKIKIFDIDIVKTKLERAKIKKQIKGLENKLKQNKNNFDLDFIKFIKLINIRIKQMNLKIRVGADNAAITAILVGIGYLLCSNLFKNKINNFEEQKYVIEPIYNKKILNIKFEGIFFVDMTNIIYIMFKILEKRRVEKNGTSDRRSYAYSNE